MPYYYLSYYYPYMVYLDLKQGGARIPIVDRIRKWSSGSKTFKQFNCNYFESKMEPFRDLNCAVRLRTWSDRRGNN